MNDHLRDAYIWIDSILKTLEVPFQVSGGFAGYVYGTNRPVADIDIGVRDADFSKIIEQVSNYITEDFREGYEDEIWRLKLVTLEYASQEIDIFAADTAVFKNSITNEWESLPFDITKTEFVNLAGLEIPLIPKLDLIAYKKKMQREVDMEDVMQLER